MNWQLATFLPPAMQPVFEETVVEFIGLMHERKRAGHGASGFEPTGDAVHISHGRNHRPRRPPRKPARQTSPKPCAGRSQQLIRRQHNEDACTRTLAADYAFPDLPGPRTSRSKTPLYS